MAQIVSVIAILALGLASLNTIFASASPTRPTVNLKNGTYYGQFNSKYKQDFFLGLPYAQPPVGDLRFRPAESLNSTWKGQRNATEYSPQCFGYGSDTWVLGNYVSEDCLTINIVRPHGISPDAKLPVGLWIHGGGLRNGGSSDPRYNQSFIVEQSVKMRTPIIAASINYRLHAWGFLWSKEVQKSGATNLGFRDQRKALEWVNENIAAFGGDPQQVTIWGESAGSQSVETQLVAYSGRDDGLFSGGILESGSGLPGSFNVTDIDRPQSQGYYETLVEKSNCTNADDTLQCLRGVPSWTLSDIINSTASVGFSAVTDGDFLEQDRIDLFKDGKFAQVPILIGTNFDEGASFGQRGINTTKEWKQFVRDTYGADHETVSIISTLYPDIPSIGIPATLDGRPQGDFAGYGKQFKRVASLTGDMAMHAARRYVARQWAAANATAYTYHFNTQVNGFTAADGVGHFQEVAFVFDNTEGLGYDTPVAVNPFEGAPESFGRLADTMSRMWVSFISDQTPNHNGATCTHWPKYSSDNPQNMVFDANKSNIASLEPDTFRLEQMEYLMGKLWGGQHSTDEQREL